MGMADLFQTQAVAIAAGGATAQSGTVIFADANAVSFGLVGQTVTASFGAGIPSISAGTTRVTSGEVVFSNSNNVSFGLNGQTVTAIATFPANISFGISAGTQSVSSGTVSFANSNGISFGMSGFSQITASYTVPSTTGLISAINVSAGTTSNNLTDLVFSNSNGVSFGLAGSTITANVSVTVSTSPPILSIWENQSAEMAQGSTFTSFSMVPLSPEIVNGLITANTFMVGMNGVSIQTVSSGSMLFSFGIYTWNGSTLSLMNSVATSLTYDAVSNNPANFLGFRWLTIHSSQWSLPPTFSQTNYWLGYIISSSNATQSLMLAGQALLNAQPRYGTMGVSQTVTAGSFGWSPFMGAYTAATSALPVSVNQSDLDAAATNVGNFLPHVVLNNLMASF